VAARKSVGAGNVAASRAAAGAVAASSVAAEEVVAWLERTGTRATREGMLRYGIPNDRAFGVPVGAMRAEAKRIGRSHALAGALWRTGWYEARMMAAFVDDPRLVTRRQMDAWAKDFDNWAITDTVCFHLFDETPFAWERALAWAESSKEFVKRAGYVLMAVLAPRDDDRSDEDFLGLLTLIERDASDERNFVKKGVNWALRAIGRRNPALNEAALVVAERLGASEDASARWVGKDAARELKSAKVQAALKRRL
jgi:3-methyladenine DNA glycosylase AlkD